MKKRFVLGIFVAAMVFVFFCTTGQLFAQEKTMKL
ncbi:MAG: hypothetical protein H6Q92_1799, partial [Nitrospirae bacterium]|nr:hypothetical protein [Nitrospirota bacterium]